MVWGIVVGALPACLLCALHRPPPCSCAPIPSAAPPAPAHSSLPLPLTPRNSAVVTNTAGKASFIMNLLLLFSLMFTGFLVEVNSIPGERSAYQTRPWLSTMAEHHGRAPWEGTMGGVACPPAGPQRLVPCPWSPSAQAGSAGSTTCRSSIMRLKPWSATKSSAAPLACWCACRGRGAPHPSVRCCGGMGLLRLAGSARAPLRRA